MTMEITAMKKAVAAGGYDGTIELYRTEKGWGAYLSLDTENYSGSAKAALAAMRPVLVAALEQIDAEVASPGDY